MKQTIDNTDGTKSKSKDKNKHVNLKFEPIFWCCNIL